MLFYHQITVDKSCILAIIYAYPTRVGTPRSEFIARFKYGNYKPWKAWVNFIVKNFTIEEYLHLATTIHPRGAMEAKGYTGK